MTSQWRHEVVDIKVTDYSELLSNLKFSAKKVPNIKISLGFWLIEKENAISLTNTLKVSRPYTEDMFQNIMIFLFCGSNHP